MAKTEETVRVLAGYVFEPGTHDDWADLSLPLPEDAREWLGRKGLLGKNATTRMALCGAHALMHVCFADVPKGSATGVVVSSNFGNVDVVLRDARSLKHEGERALSPLDAATHSANMVASSLAIRYGWKGPNFTVCSGTRSGRDALLIANALLAGKRCERVVLVGAEDTIPSPFRLPGESDRPLAAVLLLDASRGQPIAELREIPFSYSLPQQHGANAIAELADCVRPGGPAHMARRGP